MYDSTSQRIPGYRFQYHVPPKSAPFSMIRMSSTPAWRRRPAAMSPENPPPTMATSTKSVSGARVKSFGV